MQKTDFYTAVYKKTVYISGVISGDPNYKLKFDRASDALTYSGASKVFNPAILPAGWEYVEYMEHCLLMLRRADSIILLPDWQHSPGANAEVALAGALGLNIADFRAYRLLTGGEIIAEGDEFCSTGWPNGANSIRLPWEPVPSANFGLEYLPADYRPTRREITDQFNSTKRRV